MDISLCPNCQKGELRQHVPLLVNCPVNQGTLNKAAIRKADVKIEGAYWERATIYCPHCHAIGVATETGGGQQSLSDFLEFVKTGKPPETVEADEVKYLLDTLPDNYTATTELIIKHRR